MIIDANSHDNALNKFRLIRYTFGVHKTKNRGKSSLIQKKEILSLIFDCLRNAAREQVFFSFIFLYYYTK